MLQMQHSLIFDSTSKTRLGGGAACAMAGVCERHRTRQAATNIKQPRHYLGTLVKSVSSYAVQEKCPKQRQFLTGTRWKRPPRCAKQPGCVSRAPVGATKAITSPCQRVICFLSVNKKDTNNNSAILSIHYRRKHASKAGGGLKKGKFVFDHHTLNFRAVLS